MKKLLLASFIFLASCTTVPAPIITTSCNPSAELMQKEETSLPEIKSQTLTEPEILGHWMSDDADLITVRKEKNALIDHIQTYCQGKQQIK